MSHGRITSKEDMFELGFDDQVSIVDTSSLYTLKNGSVVGKVTAMEKNDNGYTVRLGDGHRLKWNESRNEPSERLYVDSLCEDYVPFFDFKSAEEFRLSCLRSVLREEIATMNQMIEHKKAEIERTHELERTL